MLRQRRGKEKGKSRVTLRAHERGKQDRSDRANRPVCPETSAPPSVGAAAGAAPPRPVLAPEQSHQSYTRHFCPRNAIRDQNH